LEDYGLVVEHYRKPEVLKEIARFSKKRWVAVHCEEKDERRRPILVRYRRDPGGRRKPLSVERPEDVKRILEDLRPLRPRTFYASSAVYAKLEEEEDTYPHGNALAFTPTWDVDNELAYWKATVEAAEAILAFLEKKGVIKSVFVKWSGRGAHVHLHHGSISPEVFSKHGPLDVAYAIVEYVLLKVGPELADIAHRHGTSRLKVENKMDPQRVFTCPLTLHRELDVVAVCIRPDELADFTPDWAKLGSFRHWTGWDRYEPGEADELALKALEVVGPYPRPYRPRRRKTKRVEEMIMRFLSRETP